jgi:hypothetical protein
MRGGEVRSGSLFSYVDLTTGGRQRAPMRRVADPSGK